MKKILTVLSICLLGLLQTSSASADELTVTIESNQAAGGFYFTPVWGGVHDGSFDLFNAGDAASNSLQALAEGGATGDVSGDFMASHPTGSDGTIISPGGFAGAPVFDPGETASHVFDVANPSGNQYFSFATMLIPTNDTFAGNDDSMAYQLYDAAGNFIFTGTINVFASDLWDAGTEVNDINGGAAFSANGGDRADENGVIGLASLADLNAFVGTDTAAGTTISDPLAADELVFTISFSNTAVPEPGSMGFLAVAGIGALLRRRRS